MENLESHGILHFNFQHMFKALKVMEKCIFLSHGILIMKMIDICGCFFE